MHLIEYHLLYARDCEGQSDGFKGAVNIYYSKGKNDRRTR
jgi:hypothetical protein